MDDMTEYVTNEREVGLPPLQSSRRAVWEYYRLEFLPGGYPGRRNGDVLYAHPIYGPYVIADYTAQFRRTKREVFLEAAMHVADAAVEHMTAVEDGLAFIYSDEKTAVSTRGGSFYSGLTQARYIEVFRKLLPLPGGDRFHLPLTKILRSLLVPAERGGVARYTANGGLIIEEYPSMMPDCTLNGWTTATCILRDYATSTGDQLGWDLFHRSVQGLEDVISLYDVPELANSRYRLTGVASLRVASDVDVELTRCEVDIPGVGTYAASGADDPAGQVVRDGARKLAAGASESFTLSLSRLSWPLPNRVRLTLNANAPGTFTASIGDGDYSPLSKNLRVDSFRGLGDFPMEAGENVIEVPVPWVDAEIVAYPTGFGKAIAGRQFNQYHWIHVDTLGKIVEETDSAILAYYRDKWARYPARWPDLPQYQDPRITLERFDPQKHK